MRFLSLSLGAFSKLVLLSFQVLDDINDNSEGVGTEAKMRRPKLVQKQVDKVKDLG